MTDSVCITPEALLMRIKALEKLVDERRLVVNDAIKAVEKDATRAEEKAEKASEKAETLAVQRQALANEWRGAMDDLISTMLPRAEYDRIHASLVDKTEMNTRAIENMRGATAGTLRMVSWAVLVLGGLIATVSLILDFTVGH